MIVIAYYTEGTSYYEDACLLQDSLDAVGMDYEIMGVKDQGSWDANVRQKPLFIREQREALKGPLLYIDVDAYVHRDCSQYFSLLGGRKIDFAAHWFAGPSKGYDYSQNCACLKGLPCSKPHRLLSGTLFFGDTDNVRTLLDVWCDLNESCHQRGWESGGGQRNLWALVMANQRHLRQFKLPGRYTYVYDKPQGYPKGEPKIIEHTIGSRDNRGPKKRKHAGRHKRIMELRNRVDRTD